MHFALVVLIAEGSSPSNRNVCFERGVGNFVSKYAKFSLKEDVFVRSWNQFQDTALNGATVTSTSDVRKASRKKMFIFSGMKLISYHENFQDKNNYMGRGLMIS